MKKKAKGAVTVFLIIVLFSVVLLGGLFIDATRILLARRYINNSLDSAARSALSYYDTHLSGEYGLFAVKEDTAEEMFRKYFKTNLALAKNDGFDILKMDVEDDKISVSMSGGILERENLLDSIEDYSKYRVVVNTSYRLVRMFSGLFGAGGKADKTFNAANTAKSAADQLRDDVKELSNSARALISSGVKTQTDNAKSLVSGMLRRGEKPSDSSLGFDEIGGRIDEAAEESGKITNAKQTYDQVNEEQRQELANVPAGSAEYWDEASGEWKTSTAVPVGDDGQSPDDLPSLGQSAMEEKSAVEGEIAETRARFEEKKQAISEKNRQAMACNDKIAELRKLLDTQKAQTSKWEEQVGTLKENKARDRFSFILGDNVDGEIKALQNAYEAEKGELESLQLQHASAERIREQEEKVIQAGETLEKAIKDSGETPKTPYDDQIKEAERKLKDAKAVSDATEKSLKAEEGKRDKLIKEIETLYDEIAASESSAGELKMPEAVSAKDKEAVSNGAEALDFVQQMSSAFQKLGSEMGKRASNTSASGAAGDYDFGLSALLDDVFGLIDRLGRKITGLIGLVSNPEGAGDALLFTDYVFSNFSFLTSQTERNNRHFQIGEVEYILSGGDGNQDYQFKCIATTVMDIAILRLAINWIDYMAHSAIPEIVTRMVTCLGRAAIRTVKDMANLIFITDPAKKTATCSLCPSISGVQLTYSDHLWIAMAIDACNQSSLNSMRNRMELMMRDTYQVQSWGVLGERMTRLHGEATVEVDLVMLTLPMFEAVLPKDNQILQDGKFLVHGVVDMGY